MFPPPDLTHMVPELRTIVEAVMRLEADGHSRAAVVSSLLTAAIVIMIEDEFSESKATKLVTGTVHIAYNTRPEGHH